jgi:hypothetical protein
MKILVIHDEFGNIKSAAIAPAGPDRRGWLRSQRGESVCEVEAQDLDPQELRRSPRNFCENYRVDTVSGGLVRKK